MYSQLRHLLALRLSETELQRSLENAKSSHVYATLNEWRGVAHPPLLKSHRGDSAVVYRAGLLELLRFVRNHHEHAHENAFLLPTKPPRDATGDVCHDAILAHVLQTWPELPLALHLCLTARE